MDLGSTPSYQETRPNHVLQPRGMIACILLNFKTGGLFMCLEIVCKVMRLCTSAYTAHEGCRKQCGSRIRMEQIVSRPNYKRKTERVVWEFADLLPTCRNRLAPISYSSPAPTRMSASCGHCPQHQRLLPFVVASPTSTALSSFSCSTWGFSSNAPWGGSSPAAQLNSSTGHSQMLSRGQLDESCSRKRPNQN
jgi:hypothetical protein